MLVYFVLGGLSLVLANYGRSAAAAALLVFGFILVAALDRRAAYSSNVPTHFARLLGPQMLVMAATLAAVFAHSMLRGSTLV